MRPYLFLIFINIYWGITQVLLKHALFYMSPIIYVMLRYGSASILLVLYFLKAKRRIPLSTWKMGFILGCLLAAQTWLNTYSLYFTSTSNSIFITQLSIILVPAFYLIRYRDRPKAYYLLGVGIILIGLFIFADAIHGALNKGDFITLVSVFFVCGQIILGEQYSKRSNILDLATVQLITAAILPAIFCGFVKTEIIWCKESLIIIFLTGIIGSGICNTLRLYVQKEVEPIALSLINIIHPIFAMVGAAIIPNMNGETEEIPLNKVIGTIIILCGLFYYLYHDYRQREILIEKKNNCQE